MRESVCVSVSVGDGGVWSTGGRGEPRMEGTGCGGRGFGSLCGPLAVCLSLSLFLRLPYLWFLALDLSRRQGVCVCVCVYTSKPKATFYGDIVKGKCILTHLIYPKTLDMSELKLSGPPSCHPWQALMVQL